MKKPFFALWILTLALFVFSWVYLPGLSKYRDLKSKEEQIESELRDVETKLKAVKEERDLLKNDVQYLEKVIRDELGLVKPGEVVYKFVQDKPKPESKVEEAARALEETNKLAEEGTVAPPKQGFTVEARKVVEENLPRFRSSESGTRIQPPKEEQAADIPVTDPAPAAGDEEPVYPRRETR